MSRYVLVVLCLAAFLLVGCGDDPTPEPVASPAQVKHAAMQNAYELGETLFYYDAPQHTQYALFYGQKRIVYIKRRILRSVQLTTQEALNLDVKCRNSEGDWATVHSLRGAQPGDYYFYTESAGWKVTFYTP